MTTNHPAPHQPQSTPHPTSSQPQPTPLSTSHPSQPTSTIPSDLSPTTSQPDLIFFGNGPLADAALAALSPHFHLLAHIRTAAELATAAQLKKARPTAHAVLASFGLLLRSDFLQLFEPEGILNIHPSTLPQYRGPSPIETAILDNATHFGVSIMKLTPDMDAGPLYYQTSLPFPSTTPKSEIYQKLAQTASAWLTDRLTNQPSTDPALKPNPSQTASHGPKNPISTSTNANSATNTTTNSTITSATSPHHSPKTKTHSTPPPLPTPTPQNSSKATYTKKLTKSLSPLDPTHKTSTRLYNEIRAYAHYPKSKYTFYGQECIILSAHLSDTPSTPLDLQCADHRYLVIDRLQPAGKKPMDARSFLNGYAKPTPKTN